MNRRKGIIVVSATVLGAVLGLISAYLTWNLIYAIGSRVVQDQEHYDYAAVMNACGALSGAILGVAASLISRRPLIAVVLSHLIAPVPFFLTVFPFFSWRDGIAEHFITVWAIGMALALGLRRITKHEEANHGLESTSAPPAAGTLETHP